MLSALLRNSYVSDPTQLPSPTSQIVFHHSLAALLLDVDYAVSLVPLVKNYHEVPPRHLSVVVVVVVVEEGKCPRKPIG